MIDLYKKIYFFCPKKPKIMEELGLLKMAVEKAKSGLKKPRQQFFLFKVDILPIYLKLGAKNWKIKKKRQSIC